MPRHSRIPSYRLHKPSGRAVVTINGKDIYLGVYESPESQAAYKREIAEWLANHQLEIGPASSTRTVNEILLAYLRHAQDYYRKHGKATKQLARIQAALRPVRELYGTSPAAEFGPLALKAVRQVMIDGGWSRNYVNACTGCIKRLWKWAVSEELVAAEIFQRVNTVEGLRKGRSKAKETKPIRPVAWSEVKLALPHVSPATGGGATRIDDRGPHDVYPGFCEITVAVRPDDAVTLTLHHAPLNDRILAVVDNLGGRVTRHPTNVIELDLPATSNAARSVRELAAAVKSVTGRRESYLEPNWKWIVPRTANSLKELAQLLSKRSRWRASGS